MPSPPIPPEDRRNPPTHITVPLPAQGEKAAVRQAAAAAGVTVSTWVRDHALTAAGVTDTTRRSARRRPDRKEREGSSGRPGIEIMVSAREKAAITATAARAQMSVSDWVRAVIAPHVQHATQQAAKETQQ